MKKQKSGKLLTENKILFTAINSAYFFSLIVSAVSVSEYNSKHIPQGDPYTYLNSWLRLSQSISENTYANFSQIFTNNWYWSQNIGVSIFSPLINSRWDSFYVVNHFYAYIASISIYLFLKKSTLHNSIKFFLSILPLMLPGGRGFLHISSIDLSALDSSFISLLIAAYFSTLNFALNSKSKPKAFFAGIVCAFAIWSRGNSGIYLILLILPVWLILIIGYIEKKKVTRQNASKNSLKAISTYCVIFLSGALFFYYVNYQKLMAYYGVHEEVSTSKKTLLNSEQLLHYVANVPGNFFTFGRSQVLSIVISILFHLFVITAGSIKLSQIISKKNKNHKIDSLIVVNTFIYMMVFIVNGIAFTGIDSFPIQQFHLALKGALTAWNPILVLIIIQIILISYTRYGDSNKKNKNTSIQKAKALALVNVFAFLVLVYTQTSINFPIEKNNQISPKEAARFSKDLGEFVTADNNRVCFLSYGLINRPLIDFYRLTQNLDFIDLYIDNYWFDLWSQIDYSKDKELKVTEGLISQFRNCAVVVLPENQSYMNPDDPYSLYKFPETYKRIVERESIDFRVAGIVNESDERQLIVLVRKDGNQNLPKLQVPYGNSNFSYKDIKTWG